MHAILPYTKLALYRSRQLPALLALALLSCGAQAVSDTLSRQPSDSSVTFHRSADGTVIFSDAPVKNGKVERRTYQSKSTKKAIANPCKGLTRTHLDKRAKRLHAYFKQASGLTGVDINLLKGVARAESCFDRKAVSRVGAKGLMQLMPRTARSMGVADIYDTEQNLSGGARYLAKMLKRYSNNVDLALAAYNAGPGNVDRYKGVPPFRETKRYIVAVKKFRLRYERIDQSENLLATSD